MSAPVKTFSISGRSSFNQDSFQLSLNGVEGVMTVLSSPTDRRVFVVPDSDPWSCFYLTESLFISEKNLWVHAESCSKEIMDEYGLSIVLCDPDDV